MNPEATRMIFHLKICSRNALFNSHFALKRLSKLAKMQNKDLLNPATNHREN